MIKVFFGKKGYGKSKMMVDAANDLVGKKGDVVFIDDDNALVVKLKHQIRFVNITDFPIDSARSLAGFVCGLISGNYDIDTIFVDGLTYILKDELHSLQEFFAVVETISKKFNVDFYFSINGDNVEFPEFLGAYV
jgi:hypothetical protein